MATIPIPLPDECTELTAEDILESLREHELVASASYEAGEFHVIPKDPKEKPFSFRLTLREMKGNA